VSGASRCATSFQPIGTTEAKFCGLQGLENSQNGERISIFREPVRPAAGTPRLDEAGAARGRPPPGVLDQARRSTTVVGGLDPRSPTPAANCGS
jgi:hypothetical protein